MDNYILVNENAIYYECNFSCDNIIFLNLGSESFFITDSRYTLEAKQYCKNCEVIESSNLVKTAKELIQKHKIKNIIFDSKDFSYETYLLITSNLKTKFINKQNFSKLKRMIKTNDEIKLLKKASILGKKGFDNLANYIRRSGLKKNEKFLNFKAQEKMSNMGEYELSFDPIIAINKNAAKPHALASGKKLRENDLLLVDAGIKYKRYCSDRTCTSFVNFDNFSFKRKQKFKKNKHQKIYEIVLKAQKTAIKKARVGMKALDIDKLARDVIDKAGYGKYFIHSTGHGVGLDIHEFPNINSKSDIVIEENMVFTIEPGIYIPNEFGVRIEDSIVMLNKKAKIL